MGTNLYRNHMEVTGISVIVYNRHKSLPKMVVWVLLAPNCTYLHFAVMQVVSKFVTFSCHWGTGSCKYWV